MGPERRPKPRVEVKESRETRGRRVFAQAVIAWMDKLTRVNRHTTLPRSLRLGAAFVPTILFTILEACAKGEIVECSKDEDEFVDHASAWVLEHPDQIQQQMDIYWPDQTINAKQLVSTLEKADVVCGIGLEDKFGNSASGQGQFWDNTIVVGVDVDLFDQALQDYKAGKWTEDYSLEEIVELFDSATSGQVDIKYDLISYDAAITYAATMLSHEVAHLATGLGHTDEASNKVNQLIESGQPVSDATWAGIDEVYAWGEAAEAVGDEEWVADSEAF